jgi:enoyl-CoA hydratase/carnithine racemase
MPSDQHPHIHTEIEPLGDTGHWARVTVSNPTRLNVLGSGLIGELTTAIHALEPDRQLRCVVLRGAGDRAFIGGADIREMVGLNSATAQAFITGLHLACAAVIEAALLPGLIGAGRARRLVYTGESISAADAERWGLVDRVVAGGDLNDATDAWVRAIGGAGPEAIRLQKSLIRQWEAMPLGDAIQAGVSCFARAYESDEPRRLMQAFLDRKRH